MKNYLVYLLIFILFACVNKRSQIPKPFSPSEEEKFHLVEFINNSIKIIAHKANEPQYEESNIINKELDFINLESIKETISKRLNELNQNQYKNTVGGSYNTNAFPPVFYALQTLVLLQSQVSLPEDGKLKAKEMFEPIWKILVEYNDENLSKASLCFFNYYSKKEKPNRTNLLNSFHNLFRKTELFIKKVKAVIKEEDKIKGFLISHIKPYKKTFEALRSRLENPSKNLDSTVSEFELVDYFKDSKDGLKSNQEIFQVITDKKIEHLKSILY